MVKIGKLELGDNIIIFYGHYRSIFDHCAITAIKFGEKTQNKGYYAVQGHLRLSGRYQSKARMRLPIVITSD